MTLFSTAPASSWARLIRPAPIALACALVLTACGKDNASSPTTAAQSGAPQVPVGVITASSGEVGLVTELPGRVEASRVAQVRARSAGILQRL